jgi:hypothetical protein
VGKVGLGMGCVSPTMQAKVVVMVNAKVREHAVMTLEYPSFMNKYVLLVASSIFLFGCYETEKMCRDRLANDFKELITFAQGDTCKKEFGDLDCAKYALAASESALRITAIEIDDDQDACDFYSDGSLLRRN